MCMFRAKYTTMHNLIQLMKCHIPNAASPVENTNFVYVEQAFFTLREIQFNSITSNTRQNQSNASSL